MAWHNYAHYKSQEELRHFGVNKKEPSAVWLQELDQKFHKAKGKALWHGAITHNTTTVQD